MKLKNAPCLRYVGPSGEVVCSPGCSIQVSRPSCSLRMKLVLFCRSKLQSCHQDFWHPKPETLANLLTEIVPFHHRWRDEG